MNIDNFLSEFATEGVLADYTSNHNAGLSGNCFQKTWATEHYRIDSLNGGNLRAVENPSV